VRRFLIVFAVLFAGAIVICGAGLALFAHALTRSGPYPIFMTDYQLSGSRSYEEAERTFSDFVAKTFPIGSDENNAIAQITRDGFQVAASSSKSVELVWKRHAGPCNELYTIVVSGDVDGRIAKTIGQLRPICL
jgi:hypothetical protein